MANQTRDLFDLSLTGPQLADAFTLQEAMGFLRTDRDQDFAGSLLAQLCSRGRLSEKQWEWVTKLADRAIRSAPRSIADHCANYIINNTVRS